MKIFWRANYLITIYLLLSFLTLIVGTGFYAGYKWSQIINVILMINPLLAFVVEWVQLLTCILLIRYKKMERTKIHYFYLLLLVILNISKCIFLLLIARDFS
jgi:FtsH-binding integral membrane protein